MNLGGYDFGYEIMTFGGYDFSYKITILVMKLGRYEI